MVFKCQEDSFLKEFCSKVVACEKVQIENVDNGKNIVQEGYEVICEDTILFPEGGGQPSDFGYLNDIPVKQVIRRGALAAHVVNHPFKVGDTVKQQVDWARRFDHMQQHSGQHLLSAILETHFHATTVSWWLGEEVCHVELDVPKLPEDQIKKVEDIVNDLIRQAKNVEVKVYSKDKEEDLEEFRSVKGLPEDHEGDIRVINIEDTDSNMCCGTHVSNLSQLQVIKLLHTEKSKRKDKILLYFLVGNRVIKRLDTCIQREQELTLLLNNNPSKHPELVDKLQKNVKIVSKNLQSVLKELAILEANKLKAANPKPKYYSLHKKEAEPDFMNSFIREVDSSDVFLFLSTGDEKAVGNIVLYGEEKPIADLGNQICAILEGKGVGKGKKFQAKVGKMANRKKAEQLVAEYFQ